MTNEEYHKAAGISRSSLWEIYSKSPFHFKNGEREETAAMRFGTAYHCAILEPNVFDITYCVKDWSASTKAGKAREGEVKELGLIPLTLADWDKINRMRDVLFSNSQWLKILTQDGRNELSAFADDPETGHKVKCRLDRLCDNGLVIDLKTAQDARSFKFIRSVAEYGYHVQEAFYRDVWQWSGNNPVKGFIFLVQEKTAPFDFMPYELSERDISIGREIYKRALETYSECEKSGLWFGYEKKATQKIEMPNWAVE